MNAVLSEAGGNAMFINNDGSVVGSPAIVFPAVLELDREVQEKCLFHLQRSSARTVFCQQVPNCPPPPGITLAGCTVKRVLFWVCLLWHPSLGQKAMSGTCWNRRRVRWEKGWAR